MKKIHLLLLCLTICLFTACHDKLWDAIDDLDVRVARLEELCKEMNTNIVSIQTIVNVVQSGDYITGVTEIKKDGEVIGYTITFANHDPITIYHGQDGKDGADGKDGQDGQNGSANAPVIGVAQDTDGVYYWTLNGEWLLDDNGNKIAVSDITSGSNSSDGTTGKDGITPQLKIEEGYWYVSYDNGKTWTQLGQATGEDGEKGDKGDKGEDGDSMFKSVTQDENYVYFTLADGTVIKIAKGNGNNAEEIVQIIDGAIMAEFSVSETKKVYFSMGNLQYSYEGTHKCADGTTQPGTWRFAEKQWEEGTMLYWGNSGYNDTVKYVYTNDWHTEQSRALTYFQSYESVAKSDISNTYNDWGVYNAIENGGNVPNKYRTLTRDEWIYLWDQRPNAENLKGTTKVDGIECTYILPDSWKNFEANIPSELYSGEQIFETFPSVDILLNKGVVFFRKNARKVSLSDNSGEGYWSSTYTHKAKDLYSTEICFYYAYAILGYNPDRQLTCFKNSSGVSSPYVGCLPVRLVKDVE